MSKPQTNREWYDAFQGTKYLVRRSSGKWEALANWVVSEMIGEVKGEYRCGVKISDRPSAEIALRDLQRGVKAFQKEVEV